LSSHGAKNWMIQRPSALVGGLKHSRAWQNCSGSVERSQPSRKRTWLSRKLAASSNTSLSCGRPWYFFSSPRLGTAPNSICNGLPSKRLVRQMFCWPL
jgi:hypothetical protein